MSYVQGYAPADPAPEGGGWGSLLGGFLSKAVDATKKEFEDNSDEWAGRIGSVLQKGISRYADSEIDNRLRISNAPALFQDETGAVGVAGSTAPAVITAPRVTVTGKAPDNTMLYLVIGAAVVFLLARR